MADAATILGEGTLTEEQRKALQRAFYNVRDIPATADNPELHANLMDEAVNTLGALREAFPNITEELEK